MSSTSDASAPLVAPEFRPSAPAVWRGEPGYANDSRRAAECKREPFRQHDLGGGTGRL